jgi:hypothetical protein
LDKRRDSGKLEFDYDTISAREDISFLLLVLIEKNYIFSKTEAYVWHVSYM